MRSHLVFALLVTVALVGCGDTKTQDSKTPESKTKTQPKTQAKHHPPHGPHEGHVFELIPEGFQHVHVEIVEDDDAKKVIAYLLDAEMAKEVQSSAAEATIEITTDGQKKAYTLKGELKETGRRHVTRRLMRNSRKRSMPRAPRWRSTWSWTGSDTTLTWSMPYTKRKPTGEMTASSSKSGGLIQAVACLYAAQIVPSNRYIWHIRHSSARPPDDWRHQACPKLS